MRHPCWLIKATPTTHPDRCHQFPRTQRASGTSQGHALGIKAMPSASAGHSPYTTLPAGRWDQRVWGLPSFPGSQGEFFLESFQEEPLRSDTKMQNAKNPTQTPRSKKRTILVCGRKKPRGKSSRKGREWGTNSIIGLPISASEHSASLHRGRGSF